MLTRRPTVPPEDRVSALDVSNLIVEAHGVPMLVGALALLDGAPLLDPVTGELRLDAVRRHVGAHLPRRLRQCLIVPSRGQGRPRWGPPVDVDLFRHVRVHELPAPGDEAALLEACTAIHEQPLDRRHPLWQMWLLTGVADGRVGLLVRLHHVIADGLAALSLLESMFSTGAAAGGGALPETNHRGPAPAPSTALVDRRPPSRTSLGAGRGRARLDGDPRAVAARMRAAASRAAQTLSLLRAGPAPAVSFNRPVGRHTRVALVRARLAAARSVAHAHGGRVNDVVLTAVAGGARTLLAARGELSAGLELRVSVIVSLRGPGAAGPGNLTGVRVSAVPVGEADPARRLGRIAADSAVGRTRLPTLTGGRLLRRWTVRVMDRQRLVNLVVSNLPGPAGPLRFAGADVLELFQLGLNQGNLALGVGVLSYAGQLNFSVFADTAVVPDAGAFVAGLTGTLDELGAR